MKYALKVTYTRNTIFTRVYLQEKNYSTRNSGFNKCSNNRKYQQISSIIAFNLIIFLTVREYILIYWKDNWITYILQKNHVISFMYI